MSRVQNILVRCGLAWEYTDDIVAGQGFNLLGDRTLSLQSGERHRFEAAFLGGILQRLVVEPGSLEEFFGFIAGDPRFHRGAVLTTICAHEIRLSA